MQYKIDIFQIFKIEWEAKFVDVDDFLIVRDNYIYFS